MKTINRKIIAVLLMFFTISNIIIRLLQIHHYREDISYIGIIANGLLLVIIEILVIKKDKIVYTYVLLFLLCITAFLSFLYIPLSVIVLAIYLLCLYRLKDSLDNKADFINFFSKYKLLLIASCICLMIIYIFIASGSISYTYITIEDGVKKYVVAKDVIVLLNLSLIICLPAILLLIIGAIKEKISLICLSLLFLSLSLIFNLISIVLNDEEKMNDIIYSIEFIVLYFIPLLFLFISMLLLIYEKNKLNRTGFN